MTRWLRTKRTIYVVLLCAALIASGYAIYNQVSSDSKAASLAAQVSQICHDTPDLARSQNLNCAQAQDVKDSDAPVVVSGPKGDKGDKGEKGDKGDLGNTGQPGVSITGPPGVPGATGDRGMNGNPGIDGKTVVGPPGPEGPQGAKGDKGDKGDQGERGADGQPGEDAPHPVSQKFAAGGSGCELQTTYSDGTVLSASAPEVMCI